MTSIFSPLKHGLRALTTAAVAAAGMHCCLALPADSIIWHNPADAPYPAIQNRLAGDIDGYGRLPHQAISSTDPSQRGQWTASKDLWVGFFTNAAEIAVRITPDDGEAATAGEMFRVDRDGIWHRCRSVADSTGIRFASDVEAVAGDPGYEYRYYLPARRPIESIGFGTDMNSRLKFMKADNDRPIVAYGETTPLGDAMGWTAEVHRALDLPLVNLSVEGDGIPDTTVTDLIGRTGSRLYILDFATVPTQSQGLQSSAIAGTISRLRSANPSTPILVIGHTAATKNACDSLTAQGIGQLHYLAAPDWRRTPAAVESRIREILAMPEGESTTTVAVSQRRDIGTYDWHQRHLDICRYVDSVRPANLLIGNSIVHYWGGEPGNRRIHGPVTWDSIMRPAGFANLGCGWDKVENVLWRIYHGEIDHTVADNVVVMIGTNNLAFNTPQEIVDGIKQLLGAIRCRQPQARIILVGLLPRRGREQLVADINIALKEVALADGYHFINPGQMLLGADGKVDESLLRDGLHPNDRGYALIAPRIVAALRNNGDTH